MGLTSRPSNRSNRSSLNYQRASNSDRSVSKGSTRGSYYEAVAEQRVEDDAIADNYVAYLPALAPSEEQYMTLGGDTRLMEGPTSRPHSEDIADRNLGKGPDRNGVPRRSSAAMTADHEQLLRKIEYSEGQSARSADQNSVTTTKNSLSSAMFINSTQSVKTPRNEGHMQWRRRRSEVSSGTGDVNDNAPRRSDYGPRNTIKMKDNLQSDQLKRTYIDGTYEDDLEGGAVQPVSGPIEGELHPDTQNIIDLSDTVDIDKSTTYAPAVTHETLKPHTHTITTEKVYRTIHNHTVNHYIQPVQSLEILPARHFTISPSSPGILIEIPESEIPLTSSFANGFSSSSAAAEQSWYIASSSIPASPSASENKFFTGERQKEPRVIKDITYMTEEGFERRETTILYPPTLEDMSNYSGIVQPIHFGAQGTAEERRMCMMEESCVEEVRGEEEVDELVKAGRSDSRGLVDGKRRVSTGNRFSGEHAIRRKPVPVLVQAPGSETEIGEKDNRDRAEGRVEKGVGEHGAEASQGPETRTNIAHGAEEDASESFHSDRPTLSSKHHWSTRQWVDKGPSTFAQFEKVAS